MLKLPKSNYRMTIVGDEHPLFKEALRTRGASETCWCGTQKTYGQCHMWRGEDKPINSRQLSQTMGDLLWHSRGCLHPNASPKECSGPVIDSHTIQRKDILEEIIDKKNHVYRVDLDPDHNKLVEAIGWRRASTFPGFCSKHDAETFKSLETSPFTGSLEQCVLQLYRTICNALYKKMGRLDGFQYRKAVGDRGLDLLGQITVQMETDKDIEGAKKVISEVSQLKAKCEKAILSSSYDDFCAKSYFFEGRIPVVSSAAVPAEYTFSGIQLCDIWDLSKEAPHIGHFLAVASGGGAMSFCWPQDSKESARLVRSFDKIDHAEKGDIFIQYCFLQCEDTYFSADWWDALDQTQKMYIASLTASKFYEGGDFETCNPKLVKWKVRKTVKGA